MSLFKRFEIWVLLILTCGGLWYVFQVQDAKEESGRAPIPDLDPKISKNNPPPPPFSLRKTTITRDGDHFLAEIEVLCRNDAQQPLALVPPTTRLLAAGGREIPVFHLPFQPPITIPAQNESRAVLRYWLNHDDINGPVSLQIGDEIIPIKTGGFESGNLPDKKSRSFTGTNWSHKA